MGKFKGYNTLNIQWLEIRREIHNRYGNVVMKHIEQYGINNIGIYDDVDLYFKS